MPGVNVTGLHFREPLGEELLHGARAVFEVNVKSAGTLRDFFQALFVQFRFHDLALAIFHETGSSAFGVADGNERTFRRADSNRESSHPSIRRRLRGFERITA